MHKRTTTEVLQNNNKFQQKKRIAMKAFILSVGNVGNKDI